MGYNCHGFTNCLSLQCRAYNSDLPNEKSKFLLFPRGVSVGEGAWLQMTGA